jgi:hypothetical protein
MESAVQASNKHGHYHNGDESDRHGGWDHHKHDKDGELHHHYHEFNGTSIEDVIYFNNMTYNLWNGFIKGLYREQEAEVIDS